MLCFICSFMSYVIIIIYLCDDIVILGLIGSEIFKWVMIINNKNYFVGVG